MKYPARVMRVREEISLMEMGCKNNFGECVKYVLTEHVRKVKLQLHRISQICNWNWVGSTRRKIGCQERNRKVSPRAR